MKAVLIILDDAGKEVFREENTILADCRGVVARGLLLNGTEQDLGQVNLTDVIQPVDTP